MPSPADDQSGTAPAPTATAVLDMLETISGPIGWRGHGDPVDELVGTILSQHTSDTNTARAFAALKQRYPTWEQVATAPTDELAETIRSGGLANIKAPRIQAVLASLHAQRGSYTLDDLDTLPVPEARKRLTQLPGVGPKTASCVLLFALGMPAMPVDTHVHRVSRRLGLIGPKDSADAAHDLLEAALPARRDTMYSFHMHLIRHGRNVCHARRPACHQCVLSSACQAYRTGEIQNA